MLINQQHKKKGADSESLDFLYLLCHDSWIVLSELLAFDGFVVELAIMSSVIAKHLSDNEVVMWLPMFSTIQSATTARKT